MSYHGNTPPHVSGRVKIPKQYIIEGIDRLGKSTLVQSIMDYRGYHTVIHFSKPASLKIYGDLRDPLKEYQIGANINMFRLIESNAKIIFDRGHLGEVVYSPMYRKYDGNYVFGIESRYNTDNAKLILLTTSNFSLCIDDGLGHDFNNKEAEQKLFIDAFNKSAIADKVIIDVHNGNGEFKTREEILKEVYNSSKL